MDLISKIQEGFVAGVYSVRAFFVLAFKRTSIIVAHPSPFPLEETSNQCCPPYGGLTKSLPGLPGPGVNHSHWSHLSHGHGVFFSEWFPSSVEVKTNWKRIVWCQREASWWW